MKNAKKILALLLCAVLLVGATIAGTLAYLTDEDSVVNTFAVGDIVIYLDEEDIDDSETAPAGGTLLNDGRDVKNEYKGDNKLIPGRTVVKDPTVWVKEGSEPAYIRMIVTVGGYDQLAAAFAGTEYVEGNMVVLSKLVDNWDYNTWKFEKFDPAAATYEFRYLPTDGIYTATADNNDATADYDELPALFESITIPGILDNAAVAKLAGVTITVNAQAIQAAGFNGDADAAWGEFTN